MDSPFPGMDPYLERYWNDVHGTLITYIKDDLNELLPPSLRATLQARLVIALVGPPEVATRYPDIAVIPTPTFGGDGGGGGTATAILPPGARVSPFITLRFKVEPMTQYSVEVVDAKSGERVITAIEVLSPENKRPGDGMGKFQTKQTEYRLAGVNRVEIDLLRAGLRLFDFPDDRLKPEHRKPYYVGVYPAEDPGKCELSAIDLRAPLPVIRIPLRAGDAKVALDLQALMRRVYRNGRFPIDYGEPCDPPLTGPDAEWAGQIVRRAPTPSAPQHHAP